MEKNLFILFILISINNTISSQNTSLQGVVINDVTQNPIIGAEISLDGRIETYSDSLGLFTIEDIPVGRHALLIFQEGYTYYYNQSLLLEHGNQDVLQFTLSPRSFTGDTVLVTESRALNEISNKYVISVEETDRYPATFFDPARLVQTLPGVIAINDQANHIAVRGQSPNLVTWRLHGLEIVNPNHTNNAGTFTDQPTIAGGGVNMISAQLLEETQFYNGYMPSPYGNAMGGTINMDFKEGNMKHWELTSQVGLLGLELGVEGPLAEDKVSMIANYRYSAVGALTGLGIDFGGEEINYQDASLTMDFNLPNGSLKLFGIWGNSQNLFTGNPDSLETFKDLFNIDFQSEIGIAGLTFSKYWSNLSWNSGLAFSTLEGTRLQSFVQESGTPFFPMWSILKNQKISFDSHLQWYTNNNDLIKTGIQLNRQLCDYFIERRDPGAIDYGVPRETSVSPYLDAQFTFNSLLKLEAGTRLVLSNRFKPSIEPNAQLILEVQKNQSLVFSTSVHRQLEHPVVIRERDRNRTKPLSIHHQIGYHIIDEKNYLKLLAFYQHGYFNLQPSNISAVSPFNRLPHAANWFSEIQYGYRWPYGSILQFNNEGQNYQRGIEMSGKKFLSESLYGLVNISFFDSKHRANKDAEWQDTRWNQNFVMNAAIGKEFTWLNKRDKSNLLGLNLRLNGFGGLREPNIDEGASQANFTTVYDYAGGFVNQNIATFRADLRVYWRRSIGKHSGLLALDVQNLTNAKNEAYHYYDPYFQNIATQFQLGIIPVISYKYFWSSK